MELGPQQLLQFYFLPLFPSFIQHQQSGLPAGPSLQSAFHLGPLPHLMLCLVCAGTPHSPEVHLNSPQKAAEFLSPKFPFSALFFFIVFSLPENILNIHMPAYLSPLAERKFHMQWALF